MRTQLRRIWFLVWAERRLYLAGLPFVAISICTGLAYPQVIRLLIDEGVQGGRVERLNQMALLLVGILLVEAVATFARDYCFNLGAERVTARSQDRRARRRVTAVDARISPAARVR